MTDNTPNKSLEKLYTEISSIITEARNNIYKSVNSEMVKAYWNIGQRIVEEEQNGEDKAKYGKAVLKEMSKRLCSKFGRGFTATNLKYMRQFYAVFPIGHALSDQLSWTHYRLLLKVNDDKARDFYIEETITCNWSTRTLDSVQKKANDF